MPIGALAGDVDVAQIMVIVFFLFFFGLVLYLRAEDKREGYPLKDPAGRPDQEGFPPMPSPKTFVLMDGGVVTAPHVEEERPLAALPLSRAPGYPMQPTADPLTSGLGPAAYAERKDRPLIYDQDMIQVLPMREIPGWSVVNRDMDPRGMQVVAADGVEVGPVVDLWIDRSVKILRYLEVEVLGGGPVRTALIPIYYSDIRRRRRTVKVTALSAAQFEIAPRLAAPNQITAREEDQVNAFFSGAHFYRGYAKPAVL
jgi:photosynthetic reaction center H subunit